MAKKLALLGFLFGIFFFLSFCGKKDSNDTADIADGIPSDWEATDDWEGSDWTVIEESY